MTCIDKLREVNPDWTEEDIEYHISESCPAAQFIAPDASFCTKTFDCKKCWEREAPVFEEENLYKFEGMFTGETMRRLNSLHDRLIGKDYWEIIQAALLLYEDALNAVDTASNRWVEMHIVGKKEG